MIAALVEHHRRAAALTFGEVLVAPADKGLLSIFSRRRKLNPNL
jgi:hypothetical protein